MNRRSFLRTSLMGGLAARLGQPATWAVEPFARPGSARLLLSLAAYSFRDFFKEADHNQAGAPTKRTLDLFQFIDFCAEHGCTGAELTSYYFPKEIDDALLLRLRRHAFLRGVEISGTAVGNNFTLPEGPARRKQIDSVNRWVDYAAIMGAPHIRVFAGDAGSVPAERAKRLCIEALEECGAHAARKGVFLGLENHGGIVAGPDAILEIVRAVRSPWVGINLDTGNFATEDPYADLERCAPYAVNVQVKVEMHPRGRGMQPADLERVVRLLRVAHYQGYVALEYEAKPDPWEAVPMWLEKLKALMAG